MRGKCIPFNPSEWPEIVVQAIGTLNDNHWFPFASLMIGMPGESDEDSLDTLELVDELKGFKTFFAPMFFTALGDCALRKKRSANLSVLTEIQQEIFVQCWKHNMLLYESTWNHSAWRHILPLAGSFFYNFYYAWRKDSKFFRRLIENIALLPYNKSLQEAPPRFCRS